MGKNEVCEPPDADERKTQQRQSHEQAAELIEQELRALVLIAEHAGLGFLGYLLRMALVEVGGMQHKRAPQETAQVRPAVRGRDIADRRGGGTKRRVSRSRSHH